MSNVLITIIDGSKLFDVEHYLSHKCLGFSTFFYINVGNDFEDQELMFFLESEYKDFYYIEVDHHSSILQQLYKYIKFDLNSDYVCMTSPLLMLSIKGDSTISEFMNGKEVSSYQNVPVVREPFSSVFIGEVSVLIWNVKKFDVSFPELFHASKDELSVLSDSFFNEVKVTKASSDSSVSLNTDIDNKISMSVHLKELSTNSDTSRNFSSEASRLLFENFECHLLDFERKIKTVKNSKLRIGVCYFGIARSLDHTCESILGNVLQPLSELCAYSSYAHLYDVSTVDSTRSNESATVDPNLFRRLDYHKVLLEAVQDVDHYCDFDKLKAYGDAWNNNFQSLRNLVLQLNSIKQVTNIALSENVDVCIFVRPDLKYHNNFLSTLVDALYTYLNTKQSRVHVPNWQHFGGINDRFAICVGQKAIRCYGERYDKIYNFCLKNNRPLHSESLVKFALKQDQVPVSFVNLKASRTRVGGVMVNENFLTRKKYFNDLVY
ncbi:hypothetical protein ACPV5S_19145 [Vibrio astriarenae]